MQVQTNYALPTPAQLKVLRLIAQGKSDKEIGKALNISHHTARTHTNALLRRVRAHSRAHAVAIGFQRGWLQ